MSTNINEMANLPIDFEIGGKTIKIIRLNIAEIFGHFEKIVKEQHMKNIKDIANIFETSKEKMEYLKEATKSIPNKLELQKLAQEYLQSESGIADVITIGLNKCQKLSDSEILDIFKNASETEVQLITQYLFGIEVMDTQPEATDVKKNL